MEDEILCFFHNCANFVLSYCHVVFVFNLVQGEASGAFQKLKAWHASHPQKESFGRLQKPFSRFLDGFRCWMGFERVAVLCVCHCYAGVFVFNT